MKNGFDVKKSKEEFKWKEWECNGKKVNGADILNCLEEELKYSEKRMKEYFGERRYQDILKKVEEINKEKINEGYKEKQLIDLIAEHYENYLAELEVNEIQYDCYDSQFEKCSELVFDIKKQKNEILQILQRVSSEDYFTFRRYLKDKSRGSEKIDIIYKTYNDSSAIQWLRSFILRYEAFFFGYCFTECSKLLRREDIFNYIDSFKVDTGSYGNKRERNERLLGKKDKDKIRLSLKNELVNIERTVMLRIAREICDLSFDGYLLFLEREIFCEEEIWEACYKINDEANLFKQRYRNDRLENEIINLGIDLNIKDIGMGRLLVPETKVEDLFEYSFSQYAFFRCVKRLQHELLPLNAILGYLNIKPSISFGNPQTYEEDKYITWRNENLFDLSIYQGMLYEILFYRVEKYLIKKEERNSLEIDKKGGAIIRNYNGELCDCVWRVPKIPNYEREKDDGSEKIYLLKQYYSVPFQIKIKVNTNLRNLVKKGKCKNQTFGSLINNVMELQSGAFAYEQYMVENSTCVMSAWALYEYTYDLIDCIEIDDRGKEKETLEKLKNHLQNLAKNIGGIHSLEARCRIIEMLKEKILYCMYDEEKRICLLLEQLNEEIRMYKEEFNMIYDLMRESLWVLFDEEKWKTLLNFQNCKCEHFTKLQEQVESLVFQKAVNEVSMRKFEKLYHSISKGENHKWYRMIWESLRTGSEC